MSSDSVTPHGKHDIAAIERAKAIGFPALNEYIPRYLGWLQDRNWPVAWPIEELLLDAGPEIIPQIIEILQGDDEGWKYFLIVGLIHKYQKQNPTYFEQIKPEILRIIGSPTKSEIHEDVHDAAVGILENDQSLPIWKNRRETLLAYGVPAEFLRAQIEPDKLKHLRLPIFLPNKFHFYKPGAWDSFEFLEGFEVIPVFESGGEICYTVLIIKDGKHNFVGTTWRGDKIEKDYGPNFMVVLADRLIDCYLEFHELGLHQLIKNGEALGFEQSAELFEHLQNKAKATIKHDREWRNQLIHKLTT